MIIAICKGFKLTWWMKYKRNNKMEKIAKGESLVSLMKVWKVFRQNDRRSDYREEY